MNDLTNTTAVVLRHDCHGGLAFLGSAFAFRKRTHFITAAHCVGTLVEKEVLLANPALNAGSPVRVVAITKHTTSDVAVLETEAVPASRVSPIYMLANNFGYGAEVAAAGFSEDSTSDGKARPTARVFRGFLQRFFRHKSFMGFEYDASELSFPAPAGLSGGPVLVMPQAMHLVGVVAENFQSTTYLRAVEEVQEPGMHVRERIHHMIQYGIVVQLKPLESWLERTVGTEF